MTAGARTTRLTLVLSGAARGPGGVCGPGSLAGDALPFHSRPIERQSLTSEGATVVVRIDRALLADRAAQDPALWRHLAEFTMAVLAERERAAAFLPQRKQAANGRATLAPQSAQQPTAPEAPSRSSA